MYTAKMLSFMLNPLLVLFAIFILLLDGERLAVVDYWRIVWNI